jgi:hypothetical protein
LHGGEVDLAAEDRGQGGGAAVEGHRGGVDGRLGEQQLLAELAAGADAGGGVLDRPAGGDDVLDRLEPGLRVGDEHVVVLGHPGDDLVVVDVDGLVRRDGQRRDVGQGAVEDHQRVTVGTGAGEFLRGDAAVRARLVQHGDRLLEIGRGRLGQGAGDQIGAATGVLPDEHADRAVGERGGGVGGGIVEISAARAQREDGGQGCTHNPATHGVSPECEAGHERMTVDSCLSNSLSALIDTFLA